MTGNEGFPPTVERSLSEISRATSNRHYCGACSKGFPNSSIDHKCLRDEFAMAALASLDRTTLTSEDMATMAYGIADCMLAARKAKATDAKIAEALADTAQARVERMPK